MTYHQVCNKSNTTGDTSGAGTAYLSGEPEFTPGFVGICVVQSSNILLVTIPLSFFPLATVLSIILRLRVLITSLVSSFCIRNIFVFKDYVE